MLFPYTHLENSDFETETADLKYAFSFSKGVIFSGSILVFGGVSFFHLTDVMIIEYSAKMKICEGLFFVNGVFLSITGKGGQPNKHV